MPLDAAPVSDTAAEHAAVRKSVGIIDRSDHGLLEVTGRDRAKFLHAMLSNDVASLASGQGCAATLLDVHGKVQVVLRVLALDDRMVVITPPDLAAKTNEALDAYLFSEKAYFRDASGDEAMAMLAGPEAPALAQRLTGALPRGPAGSPTIGAIGGPARRGGAGTGGGGRARNLPPSAAPRGPPAP